MRYMTSVAVVIGTVSVQRSFVLALFVSWFAFCSELISDEFKLVDPPPITRIVMFNSGLAQFFHEGEIDGNARV